MSSLNRCSTHVYMTWMEMRYLSTFSRLGEYFSALERAIVFQPLLNCSVTCPCCARSRADPDEPTMGNGSREWFCSVGHCQLLLTVAMTGYWYLLSQWLPIASRLRYCRLSVAVAMTDVSCYHNNCLWIYHCLLPETVTMAPYAKNKQHDLKADTSLRNHMECQRRQNTIIMELNS